MYTETEKNTMTKFDKMVIEVLSAEIGGVFEKINSSDYRNEYGETVQLLPDDYMMNDYLRERAEQNGEKLDDEEIHNSKDEYNKILIDFDIDDHGNRFSEFFFVIPQN